MRYALSQQLKEEDQKESYADNLKKMKTAGILLCYRMEKSAIPAEEAKDRTTAASPASPLRLYALSQGAYTYMTKLLPNPCPAITASSLSMLRMAAADQFVLHFRMAYPDRLQGFSLQKTIKNGRNTAILDAVIQLFPLGGKTDENSPLSIILLSVREQAKWLEIETSRLRILSLWLTYQPKDSFPPVIIFCVEQISMALALHARIQEKSLLTLWEKYYCSDTLLTVYPPLDALYRCETDEQGNPRAVRLASIH